MIEDLRVAARALARTSGMTFREAATLYQLFRDVGLTSPQAHEAALRVGTPPDDHIRGLLYAIAKAQREARPTLAERGRMAARIAAAAYEQGCLDTADMLGADPTSVPVQEMRRMHLADRAAAAEAAAVRVHAELGRPPGYCYTGGPVDWASGRPLTEGRGRERT